jgi:hypothetical protein
VENRATSQLRTGFGRLAAAVILLLLWFFTFAAAASPQLHHFIHSDAQTPGHHCVVTQIQQQSILDTCVAMSAVIVPQLAVPLSPCAFVEFVSSWDYRLKPGRGPPSDGIFIVA